MNGIPSLVFAGFFLLLFPFYVTLDGHVDFPANRHCFAVRVFGIRLLQGYAEFGKMGIVVHRKRDKAKCYPYLSYRDTEKKMEPMLAVQPYAFRQFAAIGSGYDLLPSVGLIAAMNALLRGVFALYGGTRPFLTLRSDTLWVTDEAKFVLTFRLSVFVNLLSVSVAFAKSLLEVISDGRKQKAG